MKLTVMTYNTLFGGFDGSDNKRYKLLTEIIREANPDILMVQELKNYTQENSKMLFQFENEISMPGFVATAPYTGQHTAVFIKSEIKPLSFEIDNIHFHHAAAILKVQVNGLDKPLTLISTHLNPLGPQLRIAEASYFINYASADVYTILAGDFNSVSPYDSEPNDISELQEHFRVRYLSMDGKTTDRQVISKLHVAGFVDVAHHLNKDSETTVPVKGFKGAEFMSFRSDYILTTKALAGKFKKYQVVKNSKTDYASDHYPLVAELEY